ncbi:hypothetical protein NDU88_001442 [Pleurodeles waltl]|uniref:Uncharacterized protein n=1 Tax=Pleurodeles waltl TaxID=8319 RepID=A0AAV7Q5W8_PLEWA|nr:hypothetical protein NDU88_001442 [Pleurodeles waltl]
MGARGRSMVRSDIRTPAQRSTEQGRLREDSPALCTPSGSPQASRHLRRTRRDISLRLKTARTHILQFALTIPTGLHTTQHFPLKEAPLGVVLGRAFPAPFPSLSRPCLQRARNPLRSILSPPSFQKDEFNVSSPLVL